MSNAVIFYNPYLPELKITVNGRRLSAYSALMSFKNQRLEKWAESLFVELYREINSDYEVMCISSDLACDILEELASRNPHCISFSRKPLPYGTNVYARLDTLDALGCDECADTIIPVINASGIDSMTEAIYEELSEQSVFEDYTEDGTRWDECPLTAIELRTYRYEYDIPSDAPVIIALCKSVDDNVRLDTYAPVYALVAGTETRFLGRRGSALYFSVDPCDIGTLILNIIEEEALCPLLSQLCYGFSEDERAFLTEQEREELELVCCASPICRVELPRICDVGRTVTIDAHIIPHSCGETVRVISDAPDVISADGNSLYPRTAGTSEVAVYLGDDPYPYAQEVITVRHRCLISDISLFPTVMYMPVGGTDKLRVSTLPENAQNGDEIRWESSDTSVADVDAVSGLISARACGRCTVTAYTHEVSRSIPLEVQPEIEDITCTCTFLELTVGEQAEWRYRVVPENAYGVEFLRAVSSDKNVAEYRGGYILGKSVGECKIYIKNQSGSASLELRVTVKKKRFW